MRHNKKFNHLGRQRGHRRSMLKNLAVSLIEHKRISTTLAKAKALRVYVEPIITRSKDNSMHARRTAFRYLQNKEAVKELFAEVGPKVADRPGGYVRVIRTGRRLGDNAETAIIELVDFNADYNLKGDDKKGKTRRSRRGGKKKATAASAPATAEVAVADATAAEATAAEAAPAAEVAEAAEQVTDTDQLAQVQETTPMGDAEAPAVEAEADAAADASGDDEAEKAA